MDVPSGLEGSMGDIWSEDVPELDGVHHKVYEQQGTGGQKWVLISDTVDPFAAKKTPSKSAEDGSTGNSLRNDDSFLSSILHDDPPFSIGAPPISSSRDLKVVTIYLELNDSREMARTFDSNGKNVPSIYTVGQLFERQIAAWQKRAADTSVFIAYQTFSSLKGLNEALDADIDRGVFASYVALHGDYTNGDFQNGVLIAGQSVPMDDALGVLAKASKAYYCDSQHGIRQTTDIFPEIEQALLGKGLIKKE
jgi:hypothetical protein